MTPEQRISLLEQRLNKIEKSDRYLFERLIQMFDGRNIQLGKTTGTMIGTETTQKLGFFAKTPIVQPGAISAPSSPGASYSQGVAQSFETAINSIRTTLQNLGLTA